MATLSAFVSVLPHKMMLERLGDQHVHVEVMVEKGFNPATYQPTPRQLAALADADVYLRTGVPFEHSWLPRFEAVNPAMVVLDLRDNIELFPLESHAHGEEDTAAALDPHIWTDPLLLDRQAAQVASWLQQQLPEQAAEIGENYRLLRRDLHELDQSIRQMLATVEQRQFLVFHPAWGYFARRYGWRQVAVEHSGKEPNARSLSQLIAMARQQGIKKVIVQPQNHSKVAITLATELGGSRVVADPLAEDYFAGLQAFSVALGEIHE